MRPKYSTLMLLGAAGALISVATASQADQPNVHIGVGFSDGYHGYHLRTPYYHPQIGFHHPPVQRSGPPLYYGYHYDHVPAYPVPIYRTDRAVVVHQPQVVYRPVSAAHAEWCHARYRSYRAADNTFQPYHGARRPCWSPFG